MSKFIISLDCELYWGVRAKKKIEDYSENLAGARKAIPRMLQLFKTCGVAATFATVGFLFFRNKSEWIQHFPDQKPTYDLQDQSPYTDKAIADVSNDQEGIFHFAPELINLIKEEGHEIGTHTFSHFFCQEKGQTPEQFRADLKMAHKVARDHGVELKSIVFPRNQFTDEYLRICRDEGIYIYRGNPKAPYHGAFGDHDDTLYYRFCRLADTYFNLSGYNCFSDAEMIDGDMVNVPASMFLRPYSSKLKMFEGLKLKRIKTAMTYAAKNGLNFHLWWHPHNFGTHIDKNMAMLEHILRHYQSLSSEYSFQSVTMLQAAGEEKADRG